jgi:uncharacterized damage-inducible protein DinB
VDTRDDGLLDVLLDSWDRNNTILVNLLRALPDDVMELSAAEGSPTIRGLFAHMHYVRLIFVHEDAPEFATPLPEGEWRGERDRERIAERLNESARTVREAVKGRLAADRAMDVHYDHPVLLLQHMIWHEGYHHGQIKIALKVNGRGMADDPIGTVTWDVWMDKTANPYTR